MPTAHLAIDLGASSGRAILGVLGDKEDLKLEEVHRFAHHPCVTPAGPTWDLTGIWLNVIEGIKQGSAWCRDQEIELSSIGVDTWGVDWALVSKSGELVGLPHQYRDPQNAAAMEKVLKIVGGKEELYRRTGIQVMDLNSIFQVYARRQAEPQLFDVAHRLLFMPDLFHYWLSGEMNTERTIASTSGMLALETGDWDLELMEMLGIPTHVLGPIVDPGTKLGTLRQEIAEATRTSDSVQIIAPGSHDTASAIAAVPIGPETNDDPNWAYISSGTWSLMGAELGQSFASDQSCAAPFTNELGLNGTTRFLKNIAGLWLIQELRRQRVEAGEEVTFAELADQARTATPYRTLIDPNASQFGAPGNMAEKIREFAQATYQPEPETMGDLVRCCLDSLALCYSRTIEMLESTLDIKVDVLHIVGGGIQNGLLNEITGAATQRKVVTGPVEATATGNVLIQALGCGVLAVTQEIRDVVAATFAPKVYEVEQHPEAIVPSEEVYARYKKLVS